MKVSGTMPDLTPAQLVAFVTWVVAQFVAWGWLDVRYQEVTLSAAATILVVAWKLADAIIRNGRAKALAANPGITTTTPQV